ncbi:hypothetical protein [Arthrobacter sp. ES1]|uniref:hypothetical protein n=1 Tax=Arthrobacter sp. ES1 TaxID=1897056 RepID=UPI001CFFCB42|nr:hypothetical protein [Arthrobacter sp. ES1]MCB5280569.1 hypothetical protein [Arthrobacter sp. ES1]
MSSTLFPVAVYTPRALAVRSNDAAAAVRYDSLSLDGHDFLDEPAARARTSPLAVAAAACAALGFLHGAGFLAGVILGHVALKLIKRSRGNLRGRRLARAALLVSWTPIVLVAVIFVLMVLIGLDVTVHGG